MENKQETFFHFENSFYRFWYVLDKKYGELYRTLKAIVTKRCKDDELINKLKIKSRSNNIVHIDIIENFPKLFTKQDKTSLIKILDNILDFIEKSIKHSEENIKISIQSDKDLIEMI